MNLNLTTPSETHFNGFSEEQAAEYTRLWRRQPSRAFASKVQYAAFDDPVYRYRCAYLQCEEGMTIPYCTRIFIETAGTRLTATFKANHMVILEMPDKIAAVIARFIGEF